MRKHFTAIQGCAIAAAAIGAVAVLDSSAIGQEERGRQSGEATIYRDGGYRGPALFVNEAKPNLDLPWPVNSIRVASGRWELCEQTRFRGSCRTVDSDTPLLGSLLRGLTIQSMRPVRSGGQPGNGGGSGVGVEANDQVLSGRFAEFHTQPASRGYRIPACPQGQASARCTAQTADNYCRSINWSAASSEHAETVGRGVFLSDVLCVRSSG
jgi:hypothetical protein